MSSSTWTSIRRVFYDAQPRHARAWPAHPRLTLVCENEDMDGRDTSTFTRVFDALCPAMTAGSAPSPLLPALTAAARRRRSINDRPAHPLRVVAEKSQPAVAWMAEETAHDLALVIDVELSLLHATDAAAPALAFEQPVIIIERYSIFGLEVPLAKDSSAAGGLFRLPFPALSLGELLLVRRAIVAAVHNSLASIFRVLLVFLSDCSVTRGHVSTGR